LGETLDTAPHSAWSGRIVIAKPIDPTLAAVNEMSDAGPGPISWLEARRSARPHHRYKLAPESCPTRAGRLKAATSRSRNPRSIQG
jgi:hypothetical protein